MYEDFFNLSGKPFQLTPDQRFFFNSTVHKRAMSYLQYGLEQKEGFIVITGPVGSGKTMLVRNLFSRLDPREVTAAQLANTQVEPEDMLRMVSASFGLPHQGLSKAAMLQRLESMAAARHAEGKRVLLVVDEAQNLPARSLEELRMLSNYQIAGNSLFQSFLLGQEEFKLTLALSGMEQVRQRITASYHLKALDLAETQAYVEFRLAQVGWNHDPEFAPDIFEDILHFSGGIPRRINSLCDRLLLFCCLEESHLVDQTAMQTVSAEMGEEYGRSLQDIPAEASAYAGNLDTEPDVLEDTTGPVGDAPLAAAAPGTADCGAVEQRLMAHIHRLEAELKGIKQTAQEDRKRLKKAMLMQLNLEQDD